MPGLFARPKICGAMPSRRGQAAFSELRIALKADEEVFARKLAGQLDRKHFKSAWSQPLNDMSDTLCHGASISGSTESQRRDSGKAQRSCQHSFTRSATICSVSGLFAFALCKGRRDLRSAKRQKRRFLPPARGTAFARSTAIEGDNHAHRRN